LNVNCLFIFHLQVAWKGFLYYRVVGVHRQTRSFHDEHQITPDVRDATKYLIKNGIEKKLAKKHLFKLFPNGYMQQGVQLAGLRRPTAWCVG